MIGHIQEDPPAVPCASCSRQKRVPDPWSPRRCPTGQRHGMYRHGGRTKQAQAERRYLSELMRAARELTGRI